ncbi:MAG: hypothetical protein K2X99_04740 [Gemmatimonadaceae bacterium]|nr:hypothetical protein [Gemmatimonadaceae bacterium]
MRRILTLCVCAVAGCAGDPPPPPARSAAAVALDASDSIARAAAAVTRTGRWDAPQLIERLVRAGLAPIADSTAPPRAPWFKVAPAAYRVGHATLFVWIYADSSARKRALATVDTLTAAPTGTASPFGIARLFVQQNNMAAVLIDGSERQQERVRLAIEAGLGAP